jgi:hypothetical protein
MFFVHICVWYIRTFLSQSPHSLTHSLVTETLYFPSNLWSLSMDYIHWTHSCMQKHMYADVCRSICTQKHICTHTYFPWRIFLHLWREIRFSQTISHCTDIQPPTTKIFSTTYVIWIKTSPQGVGLVGFDLCTSVASSNIEKYAKYPRFSQTISHCTDIQPPTTKIFSNTYVMWIQTSPQGVSLVGFDFVYKCGFVEYWKIREISTSASENVDFIGSTVDYDINKIFTIGPLSNIDAL